MASQGTITKYKTKTGKTKWELRFWAKDWTGKNRLVHKAGFMTRAEAKAWYDGYVSEGEEKPDITMGQLYEAYMTDMKPKLKNTTYAQKEWAFKTHILSYFEDTPITSISPHSIMKWQNKLLDARNPRNGQPYSDTYLYSLHEQMSAIMNYAVKYYKLPTNPCRVTGSIGEAKADEMTIWTPEQFQTFLQYEKKTVYRILYEILFFTGIREGELMALTPKDIPEDENVIIVRKSYAVVKGKEYIQEPKTKKSIRRVKIPEAVHQDIRNYIESVYIGQNERLCLYSKTALNVELKKVAKQAGLPEIHVHELRHSHASFLIGRGVDIATVSNRLGHEKVSTTLNTYTHMLPENDAKVTGFLDSAAEEILDRKDQGQQKSEPEKGPDDENPQK